MSDELAWRRVCLKAFENLPADTTVTLADVDAVLLAGASGAIQIDTGTAAGARAYEALIDHVTAVTLVGCGAVDAILSWAATDAAPLLGT